MSPFLRTPKLSKYSDNSGICKISEWKWRGAENFFLAPAHENETSFASSCACTTSWSEERLFYFPVKNQISVVKGSYQNSYPENDIGQYVYDYDIQPLTKIEMNEKIDCIYAHNYYGIEEIAVGFPSGAVWLYQLDIEKKNYEANFMIAKVMGTPLMIHFLKSKQSNQVTELDQDSIIVHYQSGNFLEWKRNSKTTQQILNIPGAISSSLHPQGQFIAIITSSRDLQIYDRSNSDSNTSLPCVFKKCIFAPLQVSDLNTLRADWHPNGDAIGLPGSQFVRFVLIPQLKCATFSLHSKFSTLVTSVSFCTCLSEVVTLAMGIDNQLCIWNYAKKSLLAIIDLGINKVALSCNPFSSDEKLMMCISSSLGSRVCWIDANKLYEAALSTEKKKDGLLSYIRSASEAFKISKCPVSQEESTSLMQIGSEFSTQAEAKSITQTESTSSTQGESETSFQKEKEINLDPEISVTISDPDIKIVQPDIPDLNCESMESSERELEELFDDDNQNSASEDEKQSQNQFMYTGLKNESMDELSENWKNAVKAINVKVSQVMKDINNIQQYINSSAPQQPISPGLSVEPSDATKPWCLFWDRHGYVTRRNDENNSFIEMFSNDRQARQCRDLYGCNLAALGANGCILAAPTPSNSSAPAMIEYLTFVSKTGVVRCWQKKLPLNEQIECLAIGDNFVAALTSMRYLRIYSSNGMLLSLTRTKGLSVALAAYTAFLFVITQASSPPGGGSDKDLADNTYYYDYLYIENAEEQQDRVNLLASDVLSLQADCTIDWCTISDMGIPAFKETSGNLFGLFPVWGTSLQLSCNPDSLTHASRNSRFVPLLNISEISIKASKKKFSHWWPVELRFQDEIGWLLAINLIVPEPDFSETSPFDYKLEKIPLRLPECNLWPYTRFQECMNADSKHLKSDKALSMPWEQFDELRHKQDLLLYHMQSIASITSFTYSDELLLKHVNQHEAMTMRLFMKAKGHWEASNLVLEAAAMLKLPETFETLLQLGIDDKNQKMQRILRQLKSLKLKREQASEYAEDENEIPSNLISDHSKINSTSEVQILEQQPSDELSYYEDKQSPNIKSSSISENLPNKRKLHYKSNDELENKNTDTSKFSFFEVSCDDYACPPPSLSTLFTESGSKQKKSRSNDRLL